MVGPRVREGPDQGNGVEYLEPRTVNAPGSLSLRVGVDALMR